MNGIDSSELNKQTIHIPPSVTKIFFRVGELVYNALIEEAILRQQRICIVGDFDADGITSTAMMLMALPLTRSRTSPRSM